MALVWEPAWAACEPCTMQEPLLAHHCHFYTQHDFKTGGKNCMKGNWWETPSLITYADTANKLFGQGFIAANIYAGFCKRCLLWCAAHHWREENISICCSRFWKTHNNFLPSNMLWKIPWSKLTCVWEMEGVQTDKAYSTTIFCTPCYFRNVATEFSESHASLQENIRLCLSCVCVSLRV